MSNTGITTTTAPFAPGDILVSTWGYEQTNVDFFTVVRLTPKGMAVLQPIGTAHRETGPLHGEALPAPDRPHGKTITRKVRVPRDGRAFVSITDYAVARAWLGKPVFWSAWH